MKTNGTAKALHELKPPEMVSFQDSSKKTYRLDRLKQREDMLQMLQYGRDTCQSHLTGRLVKNVNFRIIPFTEELNKDTAKSITRSLWAIRRHAATSITS